MSLANHLKRVAILPVKTLVERYVTHENNARHIAVIIVGGNALYSILHSDGVNEVVAQVLWHQGFFFLS